MTNRRSIRKFRTDLIPREKIYQLLDIGRYAPSGANMQPWVYIIVTNNQLKEKIREEAEKIEEEFHEKAPENLKKWFKRQKITPLKSFLTDAPALVIVASLTSAPYWLESTWISIAYILLSVENHELGTLTYTPRETKFLNRLLNIPSQYLPIVILPIGYPAENPSSKTRSRKSLKKTCHLNGYGQRDPLLM